MDLRAPIVLAALLLVAADHTDTPSLVDDPGADLTDLYAWMTPDAAHLNLAMTITAEQFSPGVQYVFYVGSAVSYGAEQTEVVIICTFDADQIVTCWVGEDEMVTGDARTPAGIKSDSGRTHVFAGRRQDAFYFNGEGFARTIATVKSAAPSLTFDPAGCPALDTATSSALVNMLGSDAFGGPAKNLFTGVVGTLVVQVDKTLVTPGGPIVGVWAATRR